MQIESIGIDLGKTTFHLVALGNRGQVVVRKKSSRQLVFSQYSYRSFLNLWESGDMWWSALQVVAASSSPSRMMAVNLDFPHAAMMGGRRGSTGRGECRPRPAGNRSP
jgi:hypothetical protein